MLMPMVLQYITIYRIIALYRVYISYPQILANIHPTQYL